VTLILIAARPALIYLAKNHFGVADGIRDTGFARRRGPVSYSFSFRAARIVAAKRIAYFRCSSI
jgi:hypothetical protein